MTHVYTYTGTGRGAETTFNRDQSSAMRLRLSQLDEGVDVVVRLRIGNGMLSHFKCREYFGRIKKIDPLDMTLKLSTLSAFGNNRGRVDELLTTGDQVVLSLQLTRLGVILSTPVAKRMATNAYDTDARRHVERPAIEQALPVREIGYLLSSEAAKQSNAAVAQTRVLIAA